MCIVYTWYTEKKAQHKCIYITQISLCKCIRYFCLAVFVFRAPRGPLADVIISTLFYFLFFQFSRSVAADSAQSKRSTKSHTFNSLIRRVRLVNIKIKLLEILCRLQVHTADSGWPQQVSRIPFLYIGARSLLLLFYL